METTTRSTEPVGIGVDTRSSRDRSLASARAGDASAFEVLMSSGLARTFRMAIAILGSEADARDAVQETWVAAWRQLSALTDPSRFDVWVDRILVNTCRMTIRRRGRVREIPIPDGFDAPTSQPGPDHVAERVALEGAFERLSTDQRSILVLHHLEERPVAQIATILGIPAGTVKSRLHAARAALDRILEDER